MNIGEKIVVLLASGALVVGGVSACSEQPKRVADVSAVSMSVDLREDAWKNFSAGVVNKDEARVGFEATYVGSYSTEPHWGDGYVVEKSSEMAGVYHVFTVSTGS